MNEEPKAQMENPTAPPQPPPNPVAKPKNPVAAKPAAPVPSQQPAEKAISPLAEFSRLVDKAPKEHLPTMMVKLANKCIAEKVFANPRAMALAIEGAVRVK